MENLNSYSLQLYTVCNNLCFSFSVIKDKVYQARKTDRSVTSISMMLSQMEMKASSFLKKKQTKHFLNYIHRLSS